MTLLSQQRKSSLLRKSRTALEKSLRQPSVRRGAKRLADEINRALTDPTESGVYGSHYFGADRDSMDRMGLSGYERYDRDTSNANQAAYIIWKYFPVTRTLDVGCAAGFVVEALRELGLDARGSDISRYAIDHPALGAQGFLQWGDLMTGLPYSNGEFELVTVLETLEHMKPEMIPTVLQELRRVTSKYLVATIPSFGPNAFGPGGWYEVKVRDDKVHQYYDKGPSYMGPVPFEDLYRDKNGEPIEGHLTIASFDWWTKQFEDAGFIRCGKTELNIHHDIARFGLSKYWNLYVMRVSGIDEPTNAQRSNEQVKEWEKNFGLANKVAPQDDLDALNDALRRNGVDS